MGIWALFLAHDLHQIFSSPCANKIILLFFSWILMVDFYFVGFSFEQSPRHDKYVPRFEAELSQFCEKLVGYKFTPTPPPPNPPIFPVVYVFLNHVTCSVAGDRLG